MCKSDCRAFQSKFPKKYLKFAERFVKAGAFKHSFKWSVAQVDEDVNGISIPKYQRCRWVRHATECVGLMSAIVSTLNSNERQINTKIGVGERLCCERRLKAHFNRRGLRNPITLVNKLTFARIIPLCPPGLFSWQRVSTPGPQQTSKYFSDCTQK